MSLSVTDRLREYALLMRLDKPIGFFLLLWPTLWALLVASEGQPDAQVLLVFVLGILLMRSAGCVINDFADAEIDRHVTRTQNRPLAAGRISKAEAIVLFVLLCLMALGLVLLLNTLTIMMSVVGVLLAVTYPFMKRLTYLPQIYLGAAFGWAVPMAFAAQTGSVPAIAWLLYITTVLWATAYDTMYAMVDRGDDLALGVKSTAILFGDSDRQIIGVIQVMVLVSLVMIGVQSGLGWFYYAGVCAASGLAVYQQGLIRYREREECFRAFLNNNWFGAAVFSGMLLDYIFRQI
ncbi:MAG: 4-hydroxybenzoate octaprenyltransferase [Gammaproteobacteria bacterium]|jgi:4-hydroxybenzoate polyprenyltransferase|nr:4-hydroxybenzoate octaprenyltransferase [Gammaproteobacteria bacterium]